MVAAVCSGCRFERKNLMHILGKKTQIDFMGKRKPAMVLSLLLIAAAIVFLVTRGLNFGIDFTGGTLIEVAYPDVAELGGIRDLLEESGYSDAQVQHFGTSRDVLIRIAPRADKASAELSEDVMLALRNADSAVEMRRVEFVGPQVGEELTEQGGLAVLYALIGILIYVALRFEYRFSVGAVAALIHDVIITLGIFSLLQIQFDLTVLAAILAVIGYSLNDTIVVFDRIRENFRKMRKGSPEEVMNTSINQTLTRTLMTSLTTLLVLFSLFFLGGEIIHSFALALILGVFVGTYSSIFVAGSSALALGVSKADLMPVEKEGKEADQSP
jgi:preprotein translocase subunit SecF